jgi:hypothetical protein
MNKLKSIKIKHANTHILTQVPYITPHSIKISERAQNVHIKVNVGP